MDQNTLAQIRVAVITALIVGAAGFLFSWNYSRGSDDNEFSKMVETVEKQSQLIEGLQFAILRAHPEVDLDLIRITLNLEKVQGEVSGGLAEAMTRFAVTRSSEAIPASDVFVREGFTQEDMNRLFGAFTEEDVNTLGEWYVQYAEEKRPDPAQPIPTATVLDWKLHGDS